MTNSKISSKSLESENWERRGIFSGARAGELAALYEELGYEVLVRLLDPSELADTPCRECFLLFPERFKVLYTRR
ncbi:MAG: hypothetical protein A2Z21_04595 [Candidatus Fraserbacteria bacterium RBG_16_55_9]|uniref:Uncharacterized protein n=1 Tax=Fraserbacteria sp. (strain RBG_16_55_9) TaxID=1817864 RepID=A0A1F5UVB1_FRAXR|nr:MAG: hypothetical protein A2Z21_04595 [Candidatus Fraserbacteria bacterium RBG_16_55_9]